MKVAVAGLWHLGTVTAACLASGGHDVVAYDHQQDIITGLKKGKAPLFEPGLDELLQANSLHYTSEPKDLSEAEIIWVAYDTPVDEEDRADIDFVLEQIEIILPHLKAGALIIISSQLPVGSTGKLQKRYADLPITFAYSPENLRLGGAIEVFTRPDRVVMGIQTDQDKPRITELLKPFTDKIVWMSIPSAEMTKHALNAFLATSVVFINELASICEQEGADAREVEQGLKTEMRIGARAYLRPGGAFAGGTLARDVNYLIQAGDRHDLPVSLFSAILESNQAHKQWVCRRLKGVLGNLSGKTIAVLGLTYKPGTDTLRRSTSVEICQWLNQQGAKVVAYDPVVTKLPEQLAGFIQLLSSPQEAVKQADAVVISTEWPEFISLTSADMADLAQPHIFDPSGFLNKQFGNHPHIRYFSVGRLA